ncbi:ras-related protein Rab-26-like isoform X2 [Gadus chalcogrammus]|uniref:ras-related protein Rab-26-like isoform X2 n=1 Tax=Gadus chalcogrammus TaxID=1042646 RepID=UPI0024C49319|nr:ras-related protein Rab-26-like isoform X2 [Gadus chalcogrammus]
MSRKKALKGTKGASKSPKASPCKDGVGKSGKCAVAASGGAVHPSAPSISTSGGFYDVAFKVMLVGDSGVGKTCLLVRFKDGAFLAGSFISTVGIDFRVTRIGSCRSAHRGGGEPRSVCHISESMEMFFKQEMNIVRQSGYLKICLTSN